MSKQELVHYNDPNWHDFDNQFQEGWLDSNNLCLIDPDKEAVVVDHIIATLKGMGLPTMESWYNLFGTCGKNHIELVHRLYRVFAKMLFPNSRLYHGTDDSIIYYRDLIRLKYDSLPDFDLETLGFSTQGERDRWFKENSFERLFPSMAQELLEVIDKGVKTHSIFSNSLWLTPIDILQDYIDDGGGTEDSKLSDEETRLCYLWLEKQIDKFTQYAAISQVTTDMGDLCYKLLIKEPGKEPVLMFPEEDDDSNRINQYITEKIAVHGHTRFPIQIDNYMLILKQPILGKDFFITQI